MRLCRFVNNQGQPRVGVTYDGSAVLDLTPAGVERIEQLFETENFAAHITRLASQTQTRHSLRTVKLLPPIEHQEVWAATNTYATSNAQRPALFFKAPPEKVVPSGDSVGIRKDALHSVPLPELALVINSKGKVVGYTVGNDMTARDLESETLLYLSQSKNYSRSCALGPFVTVGVLEAEARTWTIQLRIQRGNSVVFQWATSLGNIKRNFTELASFLFRSQSFPHGAVLLTGTGVVLPDKFSLQAGDNIQITVNGIGTLDNSVVLV